MKLLIFNGIWLVSHLVWLWFGVNIRRFDLPQRTQRTINVVMALAMLGVVVLAILVQR